MQQYRFVQVAICAIALGAICDAVHVPNLPQPHVTMPGGNQPMVVNGVPAIINTRAEVTVISNSFEFIASDRYIYRYELSDGTIRYETGYVRYYDGVGVTSAEGFYIYKAPDGRTVRLSYIADHRGFTVLSFQISDERINRAELQGLFNLLVDRVNKQTD